MTDPQAPTDPQASTAPAPTARPDIRSGPDDPYLIISSDCHAGLPTEEYRPYLDARFHRDFDAFLGEQDARRAAATASASATKPSPPAGSRTMRRACAAAGTRHSA